MRVVIRSIDSPLGPLVAGASSDGICLLEFPEPDRLEPQLAAIRRRLGCTIEEGNSVHLDRLGSELVDYFGGTLTEFTVAVVTAGTPFQQRVWSALRRIPYGETRSYEDVAQAIGASGAPRAVGHANGMNPVAIVVPCHRVINKSGALGGYGGQLWRKEALLKLEGAKTGGLRASGSLFT
jgi:AraC family transcriptional regulator, regulatory protein of adaptative response / methylated-DNA-[protein]-cysteine methyltransferase